MIKACLSVAFFCLALALPLRAFDWETATVSGRDYVTLQSFCRFYGFNYQSPQGNTRFEAHNAKHTVLFKLGSPDMYLDGIHYVMSFPTEGGDHDWLVSRMDVIKLFEPIIRPDQIAGRHTIRGIVIDPGHGGTDNGASSRLGMEKDYTLRTAFMLEKILAPYRAMGLKTVFTRRNDVFVDLYERANIASLYPDYLFVSIHFNSATPEAHGLETYCLSPRGAASTSSAYLTRGDIQKLPGNDYDTQNILLASLVHSEVVKLNPNDSTADRGVKRARFVVIKQNVLPAILVEGGFVSNRVEATRVNSDDYRQKLALLIARGIIRFANSMGDKNLPLPQGASDDDNTPDVTPTPPPKPIAVAPIAPAGLAHDPGNGKIDPHAVVPKPKPDATPKSKPDTTLYPVPKPDTSPPSSKTKKDKTKKTVSTPELTKPPEPAPAKTPTPPTEPSPTNAATAKPPADSLNLIEPTVPTPAPGSEKGANEPDEPPTVNFYPPAAAPDKSKPTPDAASTNAAPEGPQP